MDYKSQQLGAYIFISIVLYGFLCCYLCGCIKLYRHWRNSRQDDVLLI